ncbi:MAG: hypothetical protein ACYTGQ_08285, partial [Planctomycetota bacterium]
FLVAAEAGEHEIANRKAPIRQASKRMVWPPGFGINNLPQAARNGIGGLPVDMRIHGMMTRRRVGDG